MKAAGSASWVGSSGAAWPALALAIASFLGLGAFGGWTTPAGAQQVLLTVVKGLDPVRDVHLIWNGAPGSPYEVFRGTNPDRSGRQSLIWLCAAEHVDGNSASPPGGLYCYEVEPYTGPGILRADAGPDVGAGRAIGGLPTAAGGTQPYTYAWTPPRDLTDAAAANPVATPLVDTVYTVIVSDLDGCSASDTVAVLIPPSPLVADAGPDPAPALPCGYASRIPLGGSPAATGGVVPYAYGWTPTLGLVDSTRLPLSDQANPMLVPFDDLTYTLTVTDRISDQATDQVSITVDKSFSHCAGFGGYSAPPDYCATDVGLVDQDCNAFRLHDLRCRVVMLQFGDFT